MKKNKGFTLVELLAVIVVLAIIALIAVPTILGIIDKAKKGALKDSALGLVDAATLYYAQYGESARFDFDDNGNVISNTDKELGYKGKAENGTVIINNKGQITVCLNDNDNAAYKNYLDTNVTVVDNKNCNIPANTYIVYLGDEATINELDNAALTTKVTELEAQIASLTEQNNALLEEETLTFDEVFTVPSHATVSGSAIYRRGKTIYATIAFSGSITSWAGGQVIVLYTTDAYKPKYSTALPCAVNATTSGQILRPATVMMNTNKNIEVIFPAQNTSYGNASYSWATSYGLRLQWEIE